MKRTKKTDEMKILRFADIGGFDDDIGTLKVLLSDAGDKLDAANSHEICGTPVFQGSDKKWYVGSVEFCVEPVNKEYLFDILINDKVECTSCGNIENQESCRQDVDPNNVTVDICSQCGAVTRAITPDMARRIAGIRKPRKKAKK